MTVVKRALRIGKLTAKCQSLYAVVGVEYDFLLSPPDMRSLRLSSNWADTVSVSRDEGNSKPDAQRICRKKMQGEYSESLPGIILPSLKSPLHYIGQYYCQEKAIQPIYSEKEKRI